jgi:hypothetical protein
VAHQIISLVHKFSIKHPRRRQNVKIKSTLWQVLYTPFEESFGIIKQLMPSYEMNITLSTLERLLSFGKSTTLGLTTFDIHLIWGQ